MDGSAPAAAFCGYRKGMTFGDWLATPAGRVKALRRDLASGSIKFR